MHLCTGKGGGGGDSGLDCERVIVHNFFQMIFHIKFDISIQIKILFEMYDYLDLKNVWNSQVVCLNMRENAAHNVI